MPEAWEGVDVLLEDGVEVRIWRRRDALKNKFVNIYHFQHKWTLTYDGFKYGAIFENSTQWKSLP